MKPTTSAPIDPQPLDRVPHAPQARHRRRTSRRAAAIASPLAVALLFGLASPALAAGPRLFLFGPEEILEGDSGGTTATFAVDVFFDYPLVQCPPNDLDCNVKIVAVSVDFTAIGETASANIDFQPASGTLSDTLIFAQPGLEPLGTIEVQIVGDTAEESDETFRVVLSNAQGASLAVFTATASIVDDDAPLPPPAALSINDVTIREGDAAPRTVVFSVTLSEPATQEVTVQFHSVDATATSSLIPFRPSDYRRVLTQTLELAVGETSGTIAVEVFGDHTVEANESFSVVLTNPVNAVLADGSGRAFILNDD